jgi:hypothetical protein
MATAPLTADEVFRAIQRLDLRDLERIATRILRLRAERSAPSLPPAETNLLRRINEGLPEKDAFRYHELMDKRRAGSLSPEEHQELLRLTDAAEAIQARRIQDLAELARLRGTSLSALVEELGLKPAPDA